MLGAQNGAGYHLKQPVHVAVNLVIYTKIGGDHIRIKGGYFYAYIYKF